MRVPTPSSVSMPATLFSKQPSTQPVSSHPRLAAAPQPTAIWAGKTTIVQMAPSTCYARPSKTSSPPLLKLKQAASAKAVAMPHPCHARRTKPQTTCNWIAPQTDNRTAHGILHSKMWQKLSKSFDMHHWWMKDRIHQGQFNLLWAPELSIWPTVSPSTTRPGTIAECDHAVCRSTQHSAREGALVSPATWNQFRTNDRPLRMPLSRHSGKTQNTNHRNDAIS
jgi:hypothetical protein